MLARLASFLYARGRVVLFVAVVGAGVAGALGAGVAKRLWPYDARDSATQSVQATNRFQAAAGRQIDPGVVALVQSGEVTSAAARTRVDAVARQLGLSRLTVRTWRERWIAAAAELQRAEADQTPQQLRRLLEHLLDDAPRPGTPATFSP